MRNLLLARGGSWLSLTVWRVWDMGPDKQQWNQLTMREIASFPPHLTAPEATILARKAFPADRLYLQVPEPDEPLAKSIKVASVIESPGSQVTSASG